MPIRQVHPIGLVLGAILHVVTGWRLLADSGPVTLAVGLAVALAGITLGAWAVRTAGDQSVEHPRAHNGRSVRLHAQPYVRRVGHALRGVSMLVSGPWMLVLFPFVLAANHRRSPRGARLEALFGDAYRAYRRRLRRYF